MKNIYKLLYLTLILMVISVALQAQEAAVTWTDLTGVTINDGNLIKIAANGSNNGGAASVESLAPGEDGSASFTVHAKQFLYFGMSSANLNASKNTINYSFLLKNSNLQIRENGTRMTTISGGYAIGDKLKIERVGGIVSYLKNEEVVYTSTLVSIGPLLVDVSIINQNHEIRNAVISTEAGSPPPVPTAPDNLSLNGVTTNSIAFVWDDNSDNESGFVIQRSENNLDNFSDLNTIEANTSGPTAYYFDLGLSSGKTYYYRVAALNGPTLRSDFSNVISATTLSSIDAPSHLGVTVSGDALLLNWRDNSDNESQFLIERLVSSEGNFTDLNLVGSSSTSYIDYDVSPGNIYYYRVSAVNDVASSSPSNIDSGRLPDDPPPSGGNIVWTNLVGVEVTSGNVLRKTAADGTNNGGASSEQRLQEGVNGGTSLTVHGIVNLYYGLSDEDINASKNTIDYSFLLRASGSLQIRENGLHRLTVGTYSEGDVLTLERQGEQVNYLKNDQIVYTSTVASTTPLLVDVSITDQDDEIRDATFFEDTAAPPLNSPSNLNLTAVTATRVIMSWTDNSTDETGFTILRSSTSGGPYQEVGDVGTDITSFTDSGPQLIEGTTYYYVVKSERNTEISDPSNELMVTTLLNVPTDLVVSNTTVDAITLQWIDNSSNEDSFRVEWSTSSSGPFSEIGEVSTGIISFVHGGLSEGETHYYRVVAENAQAESSPSAVVSGTTQSVPPQVPTSVTVSIAGATSLQLTWSAIGDETGFEISRSENASSGFVPIHTAMATDRSFTDNGLIAAPGAAYYYRIRAQKGSLFSGYSNVVGASLAGSLPTNTDFSQKRQYNGNISGIKWQSHNSDAEQLYTYHYDVMNRITDANYSEKASSGSWSAKQGGFQVHGITYDLNGNIRTLNRQAWNTSGLEVIDQLTYDYSGGGNQLQNVEDVASLEGFSNGHWGSAGNEDYAYDANGNMIQDKNKEINEITYNYLNLPERVTKNDGKYILYGYDAAGVKQFQEVRNADNSLVKRTDYLGEYIYETEGSGGAAELQLIQHEEGRIVQSATNDWEYQYHLKDHLGNVRTTFTTAPSTVTFNVNYENDPDNADDIELFENVSVAPIADFNSTSGAYTDGTPYSHAQVLRSSPNSQVGSVIALPVGKGDKINVSVKAKYFEAPADPDVAVSTLSSALASAFSGGAISVNEEVTQTISNNFGAGSLIGSTGFPLEDADAPKAFLNLMFLADNQELDLVKGSTFAYDQVTAGNSESVVGDGLKNHFEILSIDNLEAPEEGYVLIYLSNEGSLADVYFDDLSMNVTEHAVVQEDDYYPFGMTQIGGFQRVSNLKNDFKYNGFEEQTELDWDVYDYQARYYDPVIGRFLQVDPAADLMRRHSPYNYAFDNPIRFIDPDGMMASDTTTNSAPEPEPEQQEALVDPTVVLVAEKTVEGVSILTRFLGRLGMFGLTFLSGDTPQNNNGTENLDDDEADEYFDLISKRDFGDGLGQSEMQRLQELEEKELGIDGTSSPAFVKMPRGNNKAKNEEVTSLYKEFGIVDKDDQRIIHDLITGKNLSRDKIKEIVKEFKESKNK